MSNNLVNLKLENLTGDRDEENGTLTPKTHPPPTEIGPRQQTSPPPPRRSSPRGTSSYVRTPGTPAHERPDSDANTDRQVEITGGNKLREPKLRTDKNTTRKQAMRSVIGHEPAYPLCVQWESGEGTLRPLRTPGIPRPCPARGRAAGDSPAPSWRCADGLSPHPGCPRSRGGGGVCRRTGQGGGRFVAHVRAVAKSHAADASVDRTVGCRRARAHAAGRALQKQPEPPRAPGIRLRPSRRANRRQPVGLPAGKTNDGATPEARRRV